MTTTETRPVINTESGPGFTVPLGELIAALNALSVAVPARPGIPVLGGVLVRRDADGVRLCTFDYETSVTVELEDQRAGDPRTVLVSLNELRKVVKAATKGETARSTAAWMVSLTSTLTSGTRLDHFAAETEYRNGERVVIRPEGKYPVQFRDSTAQVTIGGFTVPLATLPAHEYPTLPDPAATALTMDRDRFQDQLLRATVATGTDDTLPMLRGVRAELAAAELVMACTDRFRLAAVSAPVDAGSAQTGAWVIQAAPLLALVKAMPAGLLGLGMTPTTWTLRCGAVTATRQLLESEFPRWRQLLRTDHSCVVSVDRTALIRSVDKAIAVSNAVADGAKGYIRLGAAGDTLTVTPDIGSEKQDRARGARHHAVVDGPDVDAGFNGGYVLDALKSFVGDLVHLGFAPGKEPLLLANTAAELTSTNLTHVHLIMSNGPVNVA